MGGLICGVSSALHEATEIELGNGRYINDNLADYPVPEENAKVNAIGVKGLGDLGNVGTNAAVANAVYHATGRRCRTRYPSASTN